MANIGKYPIGVSCEINILAFYVVNHVRVTYP